MRKDFRTRTSAKAMTEAAAEEKAWGKIQHWGNWKMRSLIIHVVVVMDTVLRCSDVLSL